MPLSGPTRYLVGWVTSGSQNPILGVLPIGAYVVRASLHVTQAFNSSGTDNIQAGYDSDNDFYFTNTDVSSTGVKTVTLGVGIGYATSAISVEAYYTAGGGAPTTGKALVILEYFLAPVSP